MSKVIEVNHLGKKFCEDFKKSLLYGIKDIGTEIFGLQRHSDQLRSEEFWALHDISFSLEKGQSIGLIGSNGAGKSTLLRIISGLIKPDAGSVTVRGRVAPLIALGAGFNPILTGRENIRVNLSILGLSDEQIRTRFDEVVAFSELEHALDMPVQAYSSGMAARLGFSCAILAEPDILLIDEVLAVGDVKFRSKCYRKLAELKKQDTSFIIVSHNSQTILSVCEETLYLKKGQLIHQGPSHEGITRYESDIFGLQTTVDSNQVFTFPKKDPSISTGIDLTSLSLQDAKGNTVSNLVSGEKGCVCIHGFAHDDFADVALAILIRELSEEFNNSLFADSRLDGDQYNVRKGDFEIQYWLDPCCLKTGVYTVKLNINQDNIKVFDTVDTFKIKVKSADKALSASSFYQPRQWEFNQVAESSIADGKK